MDTSNVFDALVSKSVFSCGLGYNYKSYSNVCEAIQKAEERRRNNPPNSSEVKEECNDNVKTAE
jgi:hypothetical protein